MELSIYNHQNKTAIYGVFLDNPLAQPALPKNTEINIKHGDKVISLIAIKNGLLANQAELPKLPAKFTVFGKINNKTFTTSIEVTSYREKMINHLSAE